MKDNIDEFDTSDYPIPNKYNIGHHNKKIVGIMKDEANGWIILEFVGLRSKMYAILIDNRKTIKKVKGIKSNIVKNTIEFEDYKNCLFNSSVIHREQYSIRSKFHKVVTQRENKIALSPFDNKRWFDAESTDTLPWGHKNAKLPE